MKKLNNNIRIRRIRQLMMSIFPTESTDVFIICKKYEALLQEIQEILKSSRGVK